VNMDAYVRQRLAYKHAVAEEKGYITGTGVGQPLGLMTASTSGISTDRDVSSGNASTSMDYDGLINCKMKVAKQYRDSSSSGWIFHRDGVAQVMNLKDGSNRLVYLSSMVPKEPDMLLGSPVYESEYMSNTFTTGLTVGIYGDFSYYKIADCLSMEVQVLMELYARTSQVGYILRGETDGMPVQEEAFARVKLA
jgi:HK97 family phage major capsid protein